MIDQDTLLTVMKAGERRRADRRRFIRMAGAGMAAAGSLTALSACGNGDDNTTFGGPTPTPTPTPVATATATANDVAILNFALNLEYLEANFYSFAVNGVAINSTLQTGTGTQGAVTGGRKVNFTDASVAAYAREIAADELTHVLFLRSQLGSAAIAQPALNIDGSATGAFTAAAKAGGVDLTASGGVFDPYASDDNFLLGAFIFEDVGTTAYKGAASLLNSKVYVEAAAGILAVEAYHAGLIRTLLYRRGLTNQDRVISEQISNARDAVDGASDDDQGVAPVTIGGQTASNIVPTDANSIVFGRTAANVLNIAFLSKAATTQGGFFPAGVNGTIRTSNAN